MGLNCLDWRNRFGSTFSAVIRRMRVLQFGGRWQWHLDEMFVNIRGEIRYRWRAIDHAGEVLEAYTVSHQIDVLVMGAYGHARWREFILGGATKSLLSKPPLPILFSH